MFLYYYVLYLLYILSYYTTILLYCIEVRFLPIHSQLRASFENHEKMHMIITIQQHHHRHPHLIHLDPTLSSGTMTLARQAGPV